METVLNNPGGRIRSVIGAINTPAISVPAGKRWRLMSFVNDWTATATVGNRVLHAVVIGEAGSQNVWRGASSASVTAAQIGGYDVAFGTPNTTPSTTIRRTISGAANTNVQVRENCPITDLRAGDIVSIIDSAAIDAADSCAYRLMVLEYDV